MSQIYVIRNTRTGFCNRPIYVNSQQEALSVIQNVLVTDVDKALVGLKNELELLYLGEYDDVNGLVIPYRDDCGEVSNLFICTLEDIFNSIPKEMIKPAVTRDEIKALVDKVHHLDEENTRLNKYLLTHIHPTKKGVAYVNKNYD